MGIKITTDNFGVRVWRSDKHGFPQYAVKIGRQMDGEWVNEYQQVRFRNGIELENGTDIVIDDAFATLDVWKKRDGIGKRQVWMILDFHYADGKPTRTVKETRKPEVPAASILDDLPDSFSAAEDEIPFK